MKSTMLIGAALLTAAFGTACATTGAPPQPPRELREAHAEYSRARFGPAGRLAPNEVEDAKAALDRAEAAFADDPASDSARDYAYIALRKAQLAVALAAAQTAVYEREQADEALADMLTQRLATTSAELKVANQQVADAERERQEADRRADLALSSLTYIADLRDAGDRGMVLTLPSNVLFMTGQSTLLPGARAKLDQIVEALRFQGDRDIIVEGYTDNVGEVAYNRALSLQRAQAVREYLVGHGVPAARITARGFGMDRPVAENTTVEGRAQNRRVEIVIPRK